MTTKMVIFGDNFGFQNLVCLTIVCIIQNMDIDLTLKADLLPDSESSDSSDEKDIINVLVNQIRL
jgi:hypothetical protein